jgi:hypothetical protein
LVELSVANESADFQLPGESDVLNKFSGQNDPEQSNLEYNY